MLRRYWRTIATIGLAVAVAAGIGFWLFSEGQGLQFTYEHQASEKAKEYRDSARVNVQRRCALVPVAQRANCAAEQYEAAREGERKEYDLQAQLVTSAWTRAMGIAAIIGMTVGIFGLGLLYTTFRETRRSAASSEKTYQAFVDVERARLVVTPSRVSEATTKHGNIWRLEISVSNIGRSSAAITHVRYEQLPGVEFPPVFVAWTAVNSVLEAGEDRDLRAIIIDPRNLPAKPFIGGYVEYRTTLGDTHHSYFLTSFGAVKERPGDYALGSHPYTDPQGRKRFGWPDDT